MLTPSDPPPNWGHGGAVALMTPCLVQELCPEVGLAAAVVLEGCGYTVHVPEGQTCCGQPLYKQGRFARTKALARHCLEIFSGPEPVVAPSASCIAMLRRYPELFADEPSWRQRALDLAARAFELCEFLDQQAGARLQPPDCAAPAAYHESCQVRALGVQGQVRRVLGRVPGLNLVDPPNHEACCGFGGAFSLEFPEVSQAILEGKLATLDTALEQSGADTVITAEIGCLLTLRSGYAGRGQAVRVLHAAQVLAGEVS